MDVIMSFGERVGANMLSKNKSRGGDTGDMGTVAWTLAVFNGFFRGRLTTGNLF